MEYHLAIKRNASESVLMRWINLEPIIQSEVSQKEKEKYHVLTYIYIYMESRNMLPMNLFAGQQWKNIENRLMETGSGKKECEMYGENNVETYISIYQIDTSENLLYDSGNSDHSFVTT